MIRNFRNIFKKTISFSRNIPSITINLRSNKPANYSNSKNVSKIESDLFDFNRENDGSLKSKVPHISIDSYLNKEGNNKELGQSIAAALRDYGCVAIKDPRVKSNSNSEFVEMMAKYFNSRAEKYRKGEKLEEMFPEFGYETGVTPEFTERARVHKDTISNFTESNLPFTTQPPPKDSKWRYMYKCGDRKDSEDFKMPLVIPKDIPEFKDLADEWSSAMLNTVYSVSELLAIGLNLDKNTFTEKMYRGAHILGPTGSDMNNFKPGTIFAGFHYDFCMLTIHGKSNFPGLYIWLRDGVKLPVTLEDGYLLIQSGLELEYFTGGLIKAGLHEVIYTERAKEIFEERLAKGVANANWRISSTVFAHVEHDVVIEPLAHFSNEESREKYPALTGLELMKQELSETNML